ncbi:hypothetical protein LOK49_LG06G02974 [Camellia lanceoleosa]|uniref:Uncharacterized protein n=1 Tax=Camellia lanceoleosa TaxID=1840588 RepID=A0ACC0H9I2_9ERIC|nr:hypothetical protein LOK49_LG06G02974 [Camellia lanceoleosa]
MCYYVEMSSRASKLPCNEKTDNSQAACSEIYRVQGYIKMLLQLGCYGSGGADCCVIKSVEWGVTMAGGGVVMRLMLQGFEDGVRTSSLVTHSRDKSRLRFVVGFLAKKLGTGM